MNQQIENNVLELTKKLIKNKNLSLKKSIIVTRKLENSIINQIYSNLCEIVYPTYIYIFNNFTEDINLNNFSEKLNESLVNEIRDTFPYLEEIINIRHQFLYSYIDEVITNLEKFKENFFFEKISKLIISQGDSHNKGKSAIFLEIDDYNEYIYKPRSSLIEYNVCNFMKKYIKNYTYQIYDFHDFSLCEKIKYNSPNSTEKIKEFYFNQGMISALLYFINSSDNHYENIIVNESNPFYIDLECFHIPRTNNHMNYKNNNNNEIDIIDNNLMRVIDDSIFVTSIFPFTMTDNYTNLSALTGKESEIINPDYTYKSYYYEDNKYVEAALTPYTNNEKNLIYFNGEDINPSNYIEEIKSGFKYFSKLVLSKEISIEDLIRIFDNKNVKQRYVYRSTDNYYRALKLKDEPYYLQSKEKALQAIDSLFSDNENFTIIKYERNTLLRGDIPIYYIQSEDLVTGDGDIVPNFFKSTIIQSIKDKLRKFDKKMLRDQLNNIDRSLIINSYNSNIDTNTFKIENLDYNSFFKTSKNKIEELHNMYLNFSNDVAKLNFLNSQLYHTGGLILSTYFYHKESGSDINIQKIYNFLKSNNLTYKNSINSTEGISSYIYFLYYLYKKENNSEYVEELIRFLEFLKKYDYEKLNKKNDIDVFGGLSGCFIVLNNIYRNLPDNNSLKYRIKEIIEIQKQILIDSPLIPYLGSGYAHGLAGIIYSLDSYYKNFPDEQVALKIIKLIEEEDKLYRKNSNNYIDSRDGCLDNYFLCHGLPGILQSRMRLSSEFTNEEFLIKQIKTFSHQLLKNEININSFSLCHGLSSILDLYTDAYRYNLIDSDLFNQTVSYLLQKILKLSYSSFENNECFALGLSGLYYTVMRHNNPYLPSLLLFDIA